MLRHAIFLSTALLVTVPGTTALATEGHAAPAPPPTVDTAEGLLDGMVFEAIMVVDQYDAPFQDRIAFEDGMFYSEECQNACDFGWTPYYTRVDGDSITFVTRPACSDAPQSVVFEGRVTGDRIEATVVWTVERFYWTVERHATVTGARIFDEAEQAAIVIE